MKQKRREKLLILDIDNTLLFAERQNEKLNMLQEDYCLIDTKTGLCHVPSDELRQGDKEKYELYNVFLRPYVRDFLAFCQEHFTLAVYTTACLDHVDIATLYFFPNMQEGEVPWEYVWTSDDCIVRDGNKHKDLQYVAKESGFSMENILVVDDQPDVWIPDGETEVPANIIPVLEFGGMMLLDHWQEDYLLLALQQFLYDLLEKDNVLSVAKYHWENRYPNLVNDQVSNKDKCCIVLFHPVWVKGKDADMSGTKWKFGYYSTLCGEKVEVRNARNDMDGKELCGECLVRAKAMKGGYVSH